MSKKMIYEQKEIRKNNEARRAGTARRSKFEVEEITTLEAFMSLKKEWNSLLASSEINTFFLTFEWIKNWWQCFGDDKHLYILTAKKNNNLVGIAPLMITKDKKVRFIGTPLADYGDFIINESKEKNKESVLSAFLEHLLKKNKQWKSIHLDEIQERSSTVPILRMLLSKHAANKFLIHKSIGCMALDFQKSNNKELAKLLKKRGIRRHIKFLHSHGNLIFKKIENLDEAKKALNTFFEQHIAIWHKKKDPSMFLDERYKKLFEQLTEELLMSGKVIIWAIYLDNHPIAMQFGFEHNKSYITYCQSQDLSYAKQSPGTILYKHFIEEYRNKGLSIVDHSRGTEAYKHRFSNDSWKNMKVIIHNNNLKCLANKSLIKTKQRLRKIKKIVLPVSKHD